MNSHEIPTLSPKIQSGIQSRMISALVKQTLAQDLRTFRIPSPDELAEITLERLIEAKENYPMAARTLALEVYPNWKGVDVRKLYHQYNWDVERKGSAENAAPYIQGRSLLDIGGGPGTFSLELLKIRPETQIAIADINDWRNEGAKKNPSISYQPLKIGATIPVDDNSYDTGSLLYVLHHVETDHDEFLKECARCLRSTIILFEDVMVAPDSELPPRCYRPPRELEERFLSLNMVEQNEFIAVVDYICNHIASRELSMPVPGKYYEFNELKGKLEKLFPSAAVSAYFHGIYDTKCYPNPEAMYVVDFKKESKT